MPRETGPDRLQLGREEIQHLVSELTPALQSKRDEAVRLRVQCLLAASDGESSGQARQDEARWSRDSARRLE